jgi:hypothetical protein
MKLENSGVAIYGYCRHLREHKNLERRTLMLKCTMGWIFSPQKDFNENSASRAVLGWRCLGWRIQTKPGGKDLKLQVNKIVNAWYNWRCYPDHTVLRTELIWLNCIANGAGRWTVSTIWMKGTGRSYDHLLVFTEGRWSHRLCPVAY